MLCSKLNKVASVFITSATVKFSSCSEITFESSGRSLKDFARKMVVTNPCSIISPSELFRQSNEDSLMRGGGLYRSLSCTSEGSSLSLDENRQELHDEEASPLLKLMWRANSFLTQGLQSRKGGPCLPLMVGRTQIGILRSDVVNILQRYPHVFICTQCSVSINPQLDTAEARTTAVDEVLRHVRITGETAALRSWRDEKFAVWGPSFSKPLLAVERSAMALLGIRAFGVHLTGYARTPEGGIAGVWLQKRADNKPTYPGMMDTMVAGGMGDYLTPSQVLVKEAEEEASIPADIVQNAKAAGTVSFFTESERGIHANTEYVYDLELPKDFQPSINDGEAQGFAFIKTEDIMPYLLSPNFKLTSTPVLISFLIRHGIVNSDTVSDLPQIVEMLHTPLSFYYCSWPSFPPMGPVTRESSPDNTSAKFPRETVPTASSSPYCSSPAIPIVSPDQRQEHIMGPAAKNACSSMTDDDCASMKSEDRDSEEDLDPVPFDQDT